MKEVAHKFADIKRICEDEIDPTKNVKYKIEQFFKTGKIEFKINSETLEWSFQ
jgi:hypothetical protein